jgi:osmotically-inducible protein OsmY
VTAEDARHGLAARIRSRLAEDARTIELGIQVDVHGDVVVLRGQVGTARRRILIEAVARESAGGRRITNDVVVADLGRPSAG